MAASPPAVPVEDVASRALRILSEHAGCLERLTASYARSRADRADLMQDIPRRIRLGADAPRLHAIDAMLTLPTLHGIIRRRLLLNFRVDPAVLQRQLPDRLRPKLQGGHGVAGICLIRLEDIRPAHVPGFAGLSSENGAHRFAVTWEDETGPREGVYIPRRDTGSLLNHLAGGRVFPGEHHRARFDVKDDGVGVALRMQAEDDGVFVDVRAREATALPSTSIFGDLATASAFFAAGSIGYSVTHERGRLDGIKLVTPDWQIGALDVAHVASSYFDDEAIFPKGSIAFDCGLIMRDVAHEWHAEPNLEV